MVCWQDSLAVVLFTLFMLYQSIRVVMRTEYEENRNQFSTAPKGW